MVWRMIGSDGDSCTSFIHQDYENGGILYLRQRDGHKLNDEAFLKIY